MIPLPILLTAYGSVENGVINTKSEKSVKKNCGEVFKKCKAELSRRGWGA